MRRRHLPWLALAVPLVAQAAVPTIDDGLTAMMAGEYMKARAIFRVAAFNPDGSTRDPAALQYQQQFDPMVTGEPALDTLSRRRARPAHPAWTRAVGAATARPAIAEIVARARLTNVVILNEAHYSPRDRAFALEVARALRPLGYDVLAAETFNTDPVLAGTTPTSRLAKDGFVRRGTGTYTWDPVFAGYVRQALALGYRPVAYEITPEQSRAGTDVQTREDAQAANLVEAIFKRRPDAKVLIHVGHGHVREGSFTVGGETHLMMAGRLKQLTGIDPLTVEQTTLTDVTPEARDAYPIAAAKAGGRSAILFDGAQPLLLGDPGVDVQVVHPVRRYRYGRPAWLGALGGHPVAVPPALLPRTGERLVQAFAGDAPADAVPLDQVLVTAGRPLPRLMLPPRVRVRYAVQP